MGVKVRGGKEPFEKRNQWSNKGKETGNSLSCLENSLSGVSRLNLDSVLEGMEKTEGIEAMLWHCRMCS